MCIRDRLDGAETCEDPVVVDGNVTTSRGLGTAVPFALSLIEQLMGCLLYTSGTSWFIAGWDPAGSRKNTEKYSKAVYSSFPFCSFRQTDSKYGDLYGTI